MSFIELHCHLDGSLSYNFFKKRIPNIESEEIFMNKVSVPKNCDSLATYLKCFDLPISFLQTDIDITEAFVDVIESAAADNVNYIEIRFAPSFSTQKGLTLNKVAEAAIKGVQIGYELYGVHANIILCAMRHLSIEENLKVVELANKYLDNHHGICAIDLAGDEASFPNESFEIIFKRARGLNVPFTIHSGECGRSKNILLAMDYGAKRIGHGIALSGNTSLINKVKEYKLGIEMCPTSNYQTKALNAGDTYPMREFLDNNLLVTLNTDNRTVSNTTMQNEAKYICNDLEIKPGELKILYQNAIELSFASEEIKTELRKTI